VNIPFNPLPDLDTVRREVQVFLRTSPTQPEGVPVNLLALPQIRRNTNSLVLALTWFGQGQHAHLTTEPGRAAAQVLHRAAFAVQAFNEQLDAYPLAAALLAARWVEEQSQPLINHIPPPMLETLGRELPGTSVWLTLTEALGICTAQEAAQLAAWGMVKGLLLSAVSEQVEDGEREDALAALLDGLEERGRKTLN